MNETSPNLILRFVLEVVAFFAIGYWGWLATDTPGNYVLAIGLPVLAAAVWGVFNVPGDPSRSGKAPVPVPGWLRLLLELTILGAGAYALYASIGWIAGMVFVVLTGIHYATSTDRLQWLLQQT